MAYLAAKRAYQPRPAHPCLCCGRQCGRGATYCWGLRDVWGTKESSAMKWLDDNAWEIAGWGLFLGALWLFAHTFF